jgi:hypothetical protein
MPLSRPYTGCGGRNRFLGRWLQHGEGYPDWSTRLFDRKNAAWSDDPVHEKVLYAVTPERSPETFCTNPPKTSASISRSRTAIARLPHSSCSSGAGAGALQLILSPLVRFTKFYVLRLGFLDGVPGLVHTSIGCLASYMKYAKLIELNRTRDAR